MTTPTRSPHESVLIQRQFGAHAEKYVDSRDHRIDATLERMLALLDFPSQARVLDIATGGGHTARALALRARAVVASDLTYQMLQAARRAASDQGSGRIVHVQADAHDLPWAAASFDLATCRIAAHHFSDVARVVRECARVVRRGGQVAVIDNVTPADAAAARYINAFEKLRDPSHGWEYSVADWEAFFRAAGLTVEHVEESRMSIGFHGWVERLSVPPKHRLQLRVMLHHAPGAARESLNPREEGGQPTFDLGKVLLVGRAG